mmetsp:Transcript_47733/g.144329  ORF Transcript_47733/g.144329 Transcript_47733/m.144329 type:complete len:191 (-) Transcript_47733:492-1064(-)|eukprot:CAMPEP_0113546172 /NCGR_PEP_ID=MMETSP0015_2-20120614/11660_1 /TAXON_ID=2838 /ORGANISM="Odontella" /LENGTH=190 /DNA_ID=CAMNT_0000446601 /DNA_START=165 /DNA_END=737 /DNA_ORIENTATION=- /assembly_acc=CAM_ASM_000160
MKFSVKTIIFVLGATLLISSSVPVLADGETAEAVVTESGDIKVEASECPSPNADGSCPNPEADAPGEETAGEAAAEEAEPEPEPEVKTPEDPACPSRPHIIRCAAEYLDKNKNDKLDRDELQNAIDALPWLSRGVLKILGSVDKIMQKCDADGDDAIGMYDDMEQTKEQCLASCFKRKAFKNAFFGDCDL